MPKHTPPWTIYGSGNALYVQDAKGDDVAHVADMKQTEDEAWEVARLVAAAPDMLEALKGVRSWYDQYRHDGGDAVAYFGIEGIDAAIAKAEKE